jgi:PKD repeat protein
MEKGGTIMDRRLLLPVIALLLSVLLLAGLINYQGGQAQESPDDVPAPVIEDKEPVVQDSPKASSGDKIGSEEVVAASTPAATSVPAAASAPAAKDKKDDTSVAVQSSVEDDVIANFTCTIKGLNVTFNDTSVNAASWEWDFDDGNSSTDQNFTNRYALYGEYNVTLIAYASESNRLNNDSITQTIYLTADADEADDSGDDSDDDPKTPVSTQQVPEFPTIAIPMVAIIGMAFIFSRRQ